MLRRAEHGEQRRRHRCGALRELHHSAVVQAKHEVAVVDAHGLEELEQLLGHLHPVLEPGDQPRRVGVQSVGAYGHQHRGIPARGGCRAGGAEPMWPVVEAVSCGGVALVVARVQPAILSKRQRRSGVGRRVESGSCSVRPVGVLPAGPGQSAIHKRHPQGRPHTRRTQTRTLALCWRFGANPIGHSLYHNRIESAAPRLGTRVERRAIGDTRDGARQSPRGSAPSGGRC